MLRRRPEHDELGEIFSVVFFTCDLVDDEDLPRAWLAGLAVVLTFINTSLDPLLLTLGATFFLLLYLVMYAHQMCARLLLCNTL